MLHSNLRYEKQSARRHSGGERALHSAYDVHTRYSSDMRSLQQVLAAEARSAQLAGELETSQRNLQDARDQVRKLISSDKVLLVRSCAFMLMMVHTRSHGATTSLLRKQVGCGFIPCACADNHLQLPMLLACTMLPCADSCLRLHECNCCAGASRE